MNDVLIAMIECSAENSHDDFSKLCHSTAFAN